MERKAIERYLINKKEEIRSLTVKERLTSFEVSKQFVTVIVGARRTGKTYGVLDFLLNKLRLKDPDFLYLNLEDVDLDGITNKDISDTVNVHQQIYGVPPSIIYVDEPQVVQDWEKAIYSLHEKKSFKIIITGSSSKLLSKEIASALRGRTLTYSVYPLSFKEYLSFKGVTPKEGGPLPSSIKNKIMYELSAYLATGSLPDIVINPSISSKFYNDYIDLIIFRDIVERFGIKNIGIIRFVIKSLITSFSKQASIHSMYKALKGNGQKISKKTLYSYVFLLEDAYFSFQLKKFNFSNKKSELSISKTYLNDWGVASMMLDLKTEIGRTMENAVFIELKRRQTQNDKLYYSDIGDEIDFVKVEKNKVSDLIQVTYASNKNEIKEREIENLLSGSIKLNCNDLLVITWDYEAEEKVKGKKIRFVPLWKWLLDV